MKIKRNTLLATWFGAGKSPVAPGTCGSLAALVVGYGIYTAFGAVILFWAGIAAFAVGIHASNGYMRENGLTADPQEIVIDEVAGQWLVLSFMPLSLTGCLMGFILFRFFDIIKPWPVSWFDQHCSGGFGVMIDDIVAAIMGIILFSLASYIITQ